MLDKEGKNQRLRTFLEKAYNQPLSETEVLEYKNRLVKFFFLLIEIDRKQKRKEVFQNA